MWACMWHSKLPNISLDPWAEDMHTACALGLGRTSYFGNSRLTVHDGLDRMGPPGGLLALEGLAAPCRAFGWMYICKTSRAVRAPVDKVFAGCILVKHFSPRVLQVW